MKSLIGMWGLVIALGLAGTGAGEDTHEVRNELDKLQGTWRVISSQVGRGESRLARSRAAMIKIKDHTLTYEYNNEQIVGKGGAQ